MMSGSREANPIPENARLTCFIDESAAGESI
jgi:hypothetical protein